VQRELIALNTVQLRSALLGTLAPAVIELDEQGYPDRSRLYADAVRSFVSGADDLTAAERESINALAHLGTLSLPGEETVIEDDGIEEAPDVPALSPEQTEALAIRMLEEAGALFTVNTTVVASAANTARVTSIVFSSPDRDRTFDFQLDVVQREIEAIREGDQVYPYSMPFERFVGWVRG
jgi:hypothetical protein